MWLQEDLTKTPVLRGGYVIRHARRRAGISQRELAQRLSTSQSLVARWETEVVEPPFETVARAVRACGFEFWWELSTYDDQHDLLIDDRLKLSPSRRLQTMLQGAEAMRKLQRAIKRSPRDK